MSELLRPALKCFCVGDNSHCPNRGERRTAICRCPCHFTQKELQELAEAIVRVVPVVSGFLVRQAVKVKSSGGVPVAYACGHEMVPEGKLSAMAVAHIQTHRCEECREER